jgi:hypothetical protein
LLKSYDNQYGGVGKLKLNVAKKIIEEYFKSSRSTIYRLFKEKSTFFWNINDDDIYLYSNKTICINLSIHKLYHNGYSFPIKSLFHSTLKERRALMFSIVIGDGKAPQSYSTMSRRFRLSRRTIIDYVKTSPLLLKATNYSYIMSSDSLLEINKVLAENNKESVHVVKDKNNIYHILKQMPNTYRTNLWKIGSKNKINKRLPKCSFVSKNTNNDVYYSFRKDRDNAKYTYAGIGCVQNFRGDWDIASKYKNVILWQILNKEVTNV